MAEGRGGGGGGRGEGRGGEGRGREEGGGEPCCSVTVPGSCVYRAQKVCGLWCASLERMGNGSPPELPVVWVCCTDATGVARSALGQVRAPGRKWGGVWGAAAWQESGGTGGGLKV